MNGNDELKTDNIASRKAVIKDEIMQIWKYAGHSVHGNFSEAWMELNLTIAQLKCLFFIDMEGSTNQKNLAAVLGVTPPNVTGILDRLVEHNMVTRQENESNRRMQIIKLTPKSKSLLDDLKDRRINYLGSLLEQMPIQDLEAFLQGLKSLQRLEKEAASKIEQKPLLDNQLSDKE
jgi:DNA-binding MarR family transcriptional regulator